MSHRYVDADDAEHATDLVRQAIVDSLELRATKADLIFATAYEESGPLRRKRILAALDGLTSPRSRREVGAARSQLSRLIRWSDETAEWARDQLTKSPPPPDPLRIQELVARVERDHVEHQRGLLRQATLRSDRSTGPRCPDCPEPFHG